MRWYHSEMDEGRIAASALSVEITGKGGKLTEQVWH